MTEIVQFRGKIDGVYLTDEPGEWSPDGETCIGGVTIWVVRDVCEITHPCQDPATHRSWAYLSGFKVIIHLCKEHAHAMDLTGATHDGEQP